MDIFGEPRNSAVTTQWSDLSGSVAQFDVDAGRAVGEAIDAFSAPVVVQVAGRGGVGRTTVMQVLRNGAPTLDADLVETPAFDLPGADDPVLGGEVVVYVLVDSVRGADRRALQSVSPGAAVVVLNKADTVGADRASVDARVAECSEDCGFTVHPLTAAAGIGIEPVIAAIDERIRRVRAVRGGTLVQHLRRQAARSLPARDLIEHQLSTDAAVALEAAAARADLPDLVAQEPGEVRSADDALRNARWWKNQAPRGLSGSRRRGIMCIHRDYVRQWARLSGAAQPRGA